MIAEQARVLVTGGTGLVGSAVRDAVTSREGWVFVGRSDADLLSADATNLLFDRLRPTHVLHLAARVGGMFSNQRDNLGFYNDNMAMQTNVYRCCVRHGVKKLVTVLSTCIFPDDVSYPMHESDLHAGPPHDSNFGYAHAKRAVDVQNRLYNQDAASRGLDRLFTSVIPTNSYGERDNFNLADAHVIPALVHKCYLAKRDGKDLVVAGSGKPLRQFIYAPDLADLLVWAVTEYESSESIILADPHERTIADVAHIIADQMDFEGKIVFDSSRADGQHKKTVSTARLFSHKPHYQFHDLHDGLHRTVQWFLANYETCRR